MAALAVLLLLLLLKKKKKPPSEDAMEADEEVTMTTTIDDDVEFVSEYGLSEGMKISESDDGPLDLPNSGGGDVTFASDAENGSEYNPDDLDMASEPDEFR